jgi:hypothetical protein
MEWKFSPQGIPPMSFIALVLVAKILVTAILTAIPFLFLSAARLANRTGAGVGGATLFRLYGIAIAALLVGYSSGFWLIARGEFPWGVVAMGLVSNAGAATVMFASGAWRKAKPITFFIAGIALLLAGAAAIPQQAMHPLW